MQLVEGVSYAGQSEYPVYGDLGNKFGSERLFVVKHNIKVTSNPAFGKAGLEHVRSRLRIQDVTTDLEMRKSVR